MRQGSTSSPQILWQSSRLNPSMGFIRAKTDARSYCALLIQPPQPLAPPLVREHIRAFAERGSVRVASQLVDASNQRASGDTLHVLVLSPNPPKDVLGDSP